MFNVRRVVVTCSISALVPNPSWPSNTLFCESSWTDLDYCKFRQIPSLGVFGDFAERVSKLFLEFPVHRTNNGTLIW
ncbi:hypothetical protein F0562_020160 [Nyssa sinensis]|uniref:Uncharacterized protein n=1 Tax=Nyssa sinensis TaxID=561372 RepID=A0A5J5BRW8_9ASTE|nr:hypothetical protein F0562_020160 [Nyssa sinensis]